MTNLWRKTWSSVRDFKSRNTCSAVIHEQLKLVKENCWKKTCSPYTRGKLPRKTWSSVRGLIGPISYLGACYILTTVTKCIREKMTLMMSKWHLIKSHSPGYEIGPIKSHCVNVALLNMHLNHILAGLITLSRNKKRLSKQSCLTPCLFLCCRPRCAISIFPPIS